jgi:AraC-like DNA-binding protein
MADTGIISFSLESLKKMQSFSGPDDIQYEGCLFAHYDSDSDRQLNILKYPCRINAYFCILCAEGMAEIISNMRRYLIKKNSLFVSMPNDIIQFETLGNCEFYIIALNDDFAKQMKINYKNVLSVFLGIQKRPFIELSQEESDTIKGTFHNLLRDMKMFKEAKFFNEIVMNYITLLAHKGLSVISSYNNPANDDINAITHRNEGYYNRFMELLNQHYKHEHNIGFYASRICITPKYLAALIKKVSGISASHWINEFITMEAKHLIKYSNMSIQEISDYLSFTNQSFFCQYFKRQTRMTPSEYRKQP